MVVLWVCGPDRTVEGFDELPAVIEDVHDRVLQLGLDGPALGAREGVVAVQEGNARHL